MKFKVNMELSNRELYLLRVALGSCEINPNRGRAKEYSDLHTRVVIEYEAGAHKASGKPLPGSNQPQTLAKAVAECDEHLKKTDALRKMAREMGLPVREIILPSAAGDVTGFMIFDSGGEPADIWPKGEQT